MLEFPQLILTHTPPLQMDLSGIDNVIPNGVQLQQQLQVECTGCFTDPPVLEVTLK